MSRPLRDIIEEITTLKKIAVFERYDGVPMFVIEVLDNLHEQKLDR
jgi:predicted ATPase